MFHANLLARLIRLVLPVHRVIGTLHSIAESARDSGGLVHRDRLYRLTDSLADVTVAVAEAVAARHISARAVPRRKVRVIPNGIEVGRFRPDDAARARLRMELSAGKDFVWLAAGRLNWKKDYPTLLGAMQRLRDGVLWIAGGGPLESELQAQARGLGCRVRFLGVRDDVPALMNAADGLVLSSIVEGMPMVLLEAAASGLPCVATAAGGAGEVVVHGETGLLVPVGDSQALAECMQRMVGMGAAEREAMGSAARKRAGERFDMAVVVKQWEELYLES
jgi:glycosyltransferase involved in cell wall biosynthesis